MAGDWIAWVKGLSKRREVVVMAARLSLPKREVAACCMEWWEWCDSEGDFDPSRACHVSGVTFVTGLSLIDEHVGVTGFGEAMAEVGWAVANEGGELMHPRLGQWTGSAAKERLRSNRRQAKHRKSVTKMSRSKRDKSVTREEKRRESITPPIVPLDSITYPAGMDTPAVRQAVSDWLGYKRKRGQAYKDPAGQITRLLASDDFGGDPEAFVRAVDHSIASNYAGCFPPKGTHGKPSTAFKNRSGRPDVKSIKA